LEHLDDLEQFQIIKDHVSAEKKPMVQVHLIPAASGLKLFLLHGMRQYTPRTISKITKLFDEFSRKILFELGGDECNSLHYEFITKPLLIKKTADLRETRMEEYAKRLRAAILQDMNVPTHPNFYAFVVESFLHSDIFEAAFSRDQKIEGGQ
jgi:hypothetical protein